jgi:hypothetical protein
MWRSGVHWPSPRCSGIRRPTRSSTRSSQHCAQRSSLDSFDGTGHGGAGVAGRVSGRTRWDRPGARHPHGSSGVGQNLGPGAGRRRRTVAVFGASSRRCWSSDPSSEALDASSRPGPRIGRSSIRTPALPWTCGKYQASGRAEASSCRANGPGRGRRSRDHRPPRQHAPSPQRVGAHLGNHHE